jgi:hypothetical protein
MASLPRTLLLTFRNPPSCSTNLLSTPQKHYLNKEYVLELWDGGMGYLRVDKKAN